VARVALCVIVVFSLGGALRAMNTAPQSRTPRPSRYPADRGKLLVRPDKEPGVPLRNAGLLSIGGTSARDRGGVLVRVESTVAPIAPEHSSL
jgi:hypothetical protein